MTTMGFDHGTRPSRGSRARRRIPAALVAGVLALALSGCVKLEMDLDLSSDDTVDGAIVFAIDKDLLTLGGGDPADAFDDALTDSPFPTEGSDGGSVTTEVYDQDGKYGARYVLTDMPLDTFDDEDLRIERQGDYFVVTGTLDLTSGDTGSPEPMPTELMGGFDVSVSITFPGEVVEHNGTLEGTTVTWRPEGAEVVQMSAKGSAVSATGASSSATALTYGGIALAVLLLGALGAFLLLRRRSRPAPAEAPAAAGAFPVAAGAVPGVVPGPQDTLVLPDEVPTSTVDLAPDAVMPEMPAPEPPQAPVVEDPQPPQGPVPPA